MTKTNQAGGATTCRVLLVDDSTDIAKMVKAHLHDPKIRLMISSNGRDGVDAFKSSAFDLVLMDLEMPDVNGFEATRAIRFWERQNDRKPTPIAALTGNYSLQALSEVYSSGCTHYLAKPITRNVLLQTVAQHFTASHAA